MSLDLQSHLVFYGAYHNHPINQAIHSACVPLILFSFLSIASHSGTIIPTPSWLTPPHLALNLGTIAAFIWSALYVLLEPVAGSALAIMCMLGAAGGDYYRSRNPETSLYDAVGVFLAAYILQFIGHVCFERRNPKMFTSLLQAWFFGPLVVWFQILFKLGYRPGLRSRVNAAVKKEVARNDATAKNGKAH